MQSASLAVVDIVLVTTLLETIKETPEGLIMVTIVSEMQYSQSQGGLLLVWTAWSFPSRLLEPPTLPELVQPPRHTGECRSIIHCPHR